MQNEDAAKAVRNVLVILSIDGSISDEAKGFLAGLKRRLQIDESEFSQLVAEYRQSPQSMAIPRGQQGSDVFKMLIEAAKADGKVVPAERDLLERAAGHIGLSDMETQSLIPGMEEVVDTIHDRIDRIYESFNEWNSDTRRARVAEIGSFGGPSVVPLLQVLESYRVPDETTDNLELKTLVAQQLGELGDPRAVYYLSQHVNIGDTDDEISNASFRDACCRAIGNITGQDFGAGDIQEAVREWWRGAGKEHYTELAI